MLKKVLLVSLLSSFIFAAEDGAKFLVIDNKIFNKIETLNILNGGIKKDRIIKSTRLDNASMKRFYPEYFLYDGEECVTINDVIFKSSSKKDIKMPIRGEKNIKKEIRKIKLLQLLTDEGNSFSTSKVSKEILKSAGVICNKNIYFRGKDYRQKDKIGSIRIKKIDVDNGLVYGENK